MSAVDDHARPLASLASIGRLPSFFVWRTSIACANASKWRRSATGCAPNPLSFLLVQTRGGRWTFPKGGTEPGLSHAQAAAIEAFEEAGVHGRIEEVAFTTYIRRKGHQSEAAELMVNAHLCEVQRIGPPQEPGRQPTWFSAGKAKRRLREDRGVDGDELARVVDRAVPAHPATA